MSDSTRTRPTKTSDAAVGAIAHAVLADQLHAGVTQPTPREVMALVGGHPAVKALGIRGGTVRQHVVSVVGLYFRLFHPGTAWTFEDSEVAGRGCRFDHLWRRSDGTYVVDELKTGRLTELRDVNRCREQLDRQYVAATEKYGEQFGQLRLLVVGAPARSLTVGADGVVTPMTWGDR